MADFDAASFMKDVVNGLVTLTQSINIIGQPVETGGKVIVPAVVAKIVFGAGGGSGTSGDEGDDTQGSGGGGGGGATMTPVFLIVDEEGERLLTVPGPLDRAATVVEKAKDALDRIMPRKHAPDDLSDDQEMQDLAGGCGPAQ